MSKRKKTDPPHYVTVHECEERMNRGSEEFKAIKEALVGSEFGKIGGIVKDIADIKEQLKNKADKADIQNLETKRMWRPRDKALVAAAVITGLASVITAIISVLH